MGGSPPHPCRHVKREPDGALHKSVLPRDRTIETVSVMMLPRARDEPKAPGMGKRFRLPVIGVRPCSMAVAAHNSAQALTGDRHFEQAIPLIRR